jgi:hypothetical protein
MEKRPLFLRPRFILLSIVLAVVTLGLLARIANAHHTCAAIHQATPASIGGDLEAQSSGPSRGRGNATDLRHLQRCLIES